MEGRRADLEEVQRSFTVKTEEESLAAHEQTGAIQNQEKLGQKPGGRGLLRLRLDCPTLQRRLGQTQGLRATASSTCPGLFLPQTQLSSPVRP